MAKGAILFDDISSSQEDTEFNMRVATTDAVFDLFYLMPLKKNVFGEKSEGSPVLGPERPVAECDVSETKAGTEADVEEENVYVVGGVADVGVSGYESEGFSLSEILHRKRLSKKPVPQDVVDTSHLPHSEFSDLQQ